MVGQKILMVRWFLDLPCGGHSSLFNRQLTDKKQALAGLSIGFLSHADIYAAV